MSHKVFVDGITVTGLGTINDPLVAAGSGAIDITYADLATAISGNTLTPQQWYRITDYQTVHTIPQTADTYTGTTEVLQVRAVDNNSLYPIAISESYPNDIIYYNPTNNTTLVPGCTKGYIYRRIDPTIGVDICYDWREVTFRRWLSNIPVYSAGTTYNRGDFVRNNLDNNYLHLSVINGNVGNSINNVAYWDYWGIASSRIHNIYIGLSSGNPFPITASYTDYKTFAGTTTYKNVVIEQKDMISSLLYNNVFFNCTVEDVYIQNSSRFENNTFSGAYQHRDFTIKNSSAVYNNYFLGAGIFESTIDNSFIHSNVFQSAILDTTISGYSYIFSNKWGYTYSVLDSCVFFRSVIQNNITVGANMSKFHDAELSNSTLINIDYNEMFASTITASHNIDPLRYNRFSYVYLTGLTNSITHLKNDYLCDVYPRQDGTARLSYINNSDVLTIVAPTT